MSEPKLASVKVATDFKSGYDGVVVVGSSVNAIPHDVLKVPLKAVVDADAAAEHGLFVAPGKDVKRVIFSGTGPLDKDYDDVRSFAEAAEKGVKRAIEAGCEAPMLYVQNTDKFPQAETVAILGALKALYVPLEVREQVPTKATKVKSFGVFNSGKSDKNLQLAQALELGRIVSRDIGGSDPERMAAPRVEEYVKKVFEKSSVKVEVIKGQETFTKEYPCLAAVNRCAGGHPRHDGRVIWLTYEPQGPVEKTVMLVGKGITYDTGGADIKAGGIMAGMSRDKCGAADVAGFLKVVDTLRPKNVKVVGAMAVVRNSVGSNCYVSDEIITSRAGVRLRVGNTDAEGRMVMVDVLCHMKEKALKEKNPHLFTIATLTGHACLAVGPYSAVMDNGPANKEGFARKLQETGELYGDPFEVSTIRREDYSLNKCKGEYVDVIQCNSLPSSRTPRGHQFPGAFLNLVSGLDKHMVSSKHPIKYSHMDVAGSSGDLPHVPTASSVVALAMHFL